MEPIPMDMNGQLMLDGNAVAGLLDSLFENEMTTSATECAACGQTAEVGALLAFTQAPGIVLRCPTCESVVMRIVETPNAVYFDARGAAYLRLKRE